MTPASIGAETARRFTAGKRRLAGDTARAATNGEVKDSRREAQKLKAVVAVFRICARSSQREWLKPIRRKPS